jgi:hypothetical protein
MVYELSPASLEMIDGFAEEAELLINGMVAEQWETTFANPKSPAYLGVPIKEGVNTALEKTGMPTLTAPRMVELDPAVNQYLEARGGQYITWLTDSGKKDFKTLLVKSYQENGTLSGFQKIFKEQYPQMQRWKATQIWVTESNLAACNAQFSAYEQIDDVIGFRNILGPKPCPFCRFEASFDHKIGEQRPPYHVFCACIPEPIIKHVHTFREGKGDPSQFMDDKVYKRLNSSYKDFRKESIIKIDLGTALGI